MNVNHRFTLPVALLLLAAAPAAHAQTFFANDTTINTAVTGDAALGFTGKDASGNYIGPTSPTITLNAGGSVDYFLNAFNGSQLVMNGGTIFGDVYAFDSSDLVFVGGTVKGGIFAYTNSTIDFEGNVTATATTSTLAGFNAVSLTGTLTDSTAINKIVYLHTGSNASLTINTQPAVGSRASAVPEPGNLALFATSTLTGAGFLLRRRTRVRKAA